MPVHKLDHLTHVLQYCIRAWNSLNVPAKPEFLAKETKGLTARQRTKKVEKSGGKTKNKTHTENRRASDIQEMKDTILDATRRAPPSPSFYPALSRYYSARSPAPIAAFDCARYKM
jgi:hypothetical protein